MLTRNEKISEHYIYSYQVLYSFRYIRRSAEDEVLRYIQLNLNKLNLTHVMYVTFTTVARTENQRDRFYWFFED